MVDNKQELIDIKVKARKVRIKMIFLIDILEQINKAIKSSVIMVVNIKILFVCSEQI